MGRRQDERVNGGGGKKGVEVWVSFKPELKQSKMDVSRFGLAVRR